MLARLHVLLPFRFVLAEGEQFQIHAYADEGYAVHVFPLVKSDQQYPPDRVGELKLDGRVAFQADALRIDFQKESFDRRDGLVFDPPEPVVRRAINSILVRLRHVTRAPALRPVVEFPNSTWRLEYLNDDGSELPAEKGLVRMRGGLGMSFSWIAVNTAVWADVHRVNPDWEPPPWEELLLDAEGDLPRIGPALVLAATALEVLIARILDALAESGGVQTDLWKWINERGNYLREPTVEEQFDALLKFFIGHSLKENNRLWESFLQLKNARNSFVHEGRAAIKGVAVSIEAARTLVRTASEIAAQVRAWLPADMQWPVFQHSVQIQATLKLT